MFVYIISTKFSHYSVGIWNFPPYNPGPKTLYMVLWFLMMEPCWMCCAWSFVCRQHCTIFTVHKTVCTMLYLKKYLNIQLLNKHLHEVKKPISYIQCKLYEYWWKKLRILIWTKVLNYVWHFMILHLFITSTMRESIEREFVRWHVSSDCVRIVDIPLVS